MASDLLDPGHTVSAETLLQYASSEDAATVQSIMKDSAIIHEKRRMEITEDILRLIDEEVIEQFIDRTDLEKRVEEIVEKGMDAGFRKSLIASIQILAQSYRDSDPSLQVKDSMMPDPEHIIPV